METQRGVYPFFIAGADISSAINANGVGKAVMYNVGYDQEVIECTEAGYKNFAGVIATVDAEATITRSDNYVHQGARNVVDGDILGLENDIMLDVLVAGAVEFGDFLTTADGGKFKKLTLTSSENETAAQVMKIVGRAMGDQDSQSGGTVKAHIWVRK